MLSSITERASVNLIESKQRGAVADSTVAEAQVWLRVCCSRAHHDIFKLCLIGGKAFSLPQHKQLQDPSSADIECFMARLDMSSWALSLTISCNLCV